MRLIDSDDIIDSGHGSQVECEDGNETDGLDEGLRHIIDACDKSLRVLALWPEDVDITEDMEYNVIIDNVSERYWPSHLR